MREVGTALSIRAGFREFLPVLALLLAISLVDGAGFVRIKYDPRSSKTGRHAFHPRNVSFHGNHLPQMGGYSHLAPMVYDKDEQMEYDDLGKNATPRFFNPLNPFGIFGNPLCRHEGYDGICMEFMRCITLAGKKGPLCKGFRGICCRFLRECGERSSQELVYWSNFSRGKRSLMGRKKFADPASTCEFLVVKRTEHYCGLRVEPYIHSDGSTADPEGGAAGDDNCVDNILAILGVEERLELSLCSLRDSKDIRRYDIDMSKHDDLTLTLISASRINSPVEVRISQIKCKDFTKEDLSGVSTGMTGFGPGSGGSTGGTGGTTGGTGGTTGGTGGTTGGTGGTTGGTGGGGGGTDGGEGGTDGGEGGTDGGEEVKPPSPPPVPTTEEPPSPPAPPEPEPPLPDFGQCGVKGNSNRNADALEEVFQTLNKVIGSTDSNDTSPLGPPGTTNRAQTNSLEWGVPTNNETIFHYFMGPPSPIRTRITFGVPAGIHEYPWQVAMYIGGKFSCGGSIIGDMFILTAAHCVISQQNNPGSIKFHLGDWDLKSDSETPHEVVVGSAVRVHKDYSRTTLQNDIALVKINRRINFNERIRPICLPSRGDLALEGKLATITGWGRDEKGNTEGKMQELTANIISNKLCSDRWNARTALISDKMMCMNPAKGDSCNGDSGGPSIIEDPERSGRYIQVGIVSFGSSNCVNPDLPGVYTSVMKFLDWIWSHMV